MTFFEVETGNQAVLNNIVDANELNDRFSAIVDSLQYNAYLGQAWMPMEIDGTTFEYNTANSITSDSNLTAVVQPGDKITFEQETDGEYFAFVTKIDWDTTVADKTYIELFVYQQNAIEDEDITGGTVGLSRAKNPWGFPLDEAGWSIVVRNTSELSQSSPTLGNWINLGSLSITIPAGLFDISYMVALYSGAASSTGRQAWVTLSTGTSSETDSDFTGIQWQDGATGTQRTAGTIFRRKNLSLASQTIMYLNARLVTGAGTSDNIQFKGNISPTLLRATIAYL